ncbi:MAG: DUF5685 family protein [Clostridia bacterium]|nr:DUF5685 family protein [Clostridia bacterium]
MYGYLKIEKESLSEGQRGLYQAFMCQLCMSTKNSFRHPIRLCVNNDINLFNVLFHAILDFSPEVIKSRCLLSVKRMDMLSPDTVSERLSACNIVLMYFNLLDDVIDDGGIKKRLALSALKGSFKRAKNLCTSFYSQIDGIYNELLDMEKHRESSIDKVCDPFARMSDRLAHFILGDKYNPLAGVLCYNIGKWVYLIDALDDLQKDADGKKYNPLISCLGGFTTAGEFVSNNREELEFMMYSTLNSIAGAYNDMRLSKFTCLLNNVFHRSVRSITENIFKKYTPLPR